MCNPKKVSVSTFYLVVFLIGHTMLGTNAGNIFAQWRTDRLVILGRAIRIVSPREKLVIMVRPFSPFFFVSCIEHYNECKNAGPKYSKAVSYPSLLMNANVLFFIFSPALVEHVQSYFHIIFFTLFPLLLLASTTSN